MKIVIRIAMLTMFSLVAVFPSSKVFAQREIQDRAALIVAVESVDDLLEDVSYLVGAAGFPEFVPFVTFSAGEFVKGLDRAKPAGAYLTFDGETPQVVAFVAVKDLDAVLDTLSDQNVEMEKDGDFHVLTPPNGGDDVFVLEQDGWAFLSNDKNNLKDLPGDPAAIVSELAEKYVISAHVYVKNIPEKLRQQATDFMRDGFNSALENIEEQDADLAEFQRKMNEMSMQNMLDSIEQAESVSFGWGVDQTEKRTYFDVDIAAEGGTKMAKRIEAAGSVESGFLGFLRKDAAMNINYSYGMIEEDREMILEVLEQGREQAIKALDKDENLGDNEKEIAKRLANDFLDVAVETVKAGKLDFAGSLSLEPGELDFVMGGFVADTKKFADSVEEALGWAEKQIAKEEGELADKVEIKRNAETFQGIHFHTVTFEIPEDEEEAQQLLGDKMLLVIGIGDKAAYLGAGDQAIESLKKAIKAPAGQQDQGNTNITLALTPMLKFFESMEEGEIVELLVASLKETGNDKIVISGQVDGKKQSSRLEVQEGVLRLIGVAVGQFMGGLGGGEDF